MAFTEVETKKADKGHRPLPANLAVLDELEAYLRPLKTARVTGDNTSWSSFCWIYLYLTKDLDEGWYRGLDKDS